ncbi:MAG: AarF/UbiB family protein [Aigarchaeota archaeon]|nr:AarF/UbiB family protein [Aigarchaeota archaeon]MCX8192822.1 AarF/UbiB family protein [Nitrososphaeria archaeon]MDW7986066.1 RIO1 family regulatory kinase/ATPase [Nitrososphaerota archaeon]
MSLHYLVKTIFKDLEEDHFKILRILEKNMRKYEVVPQEVIVRQSNLDESSIEKLVKKLNLYKLIWSPRGRTKGYILNYNGLDLLALNNLVKKNLVESIGKSLGVGKEADVYEALSPSGENIALKFFRIGRTSFKGYGKKRPSLSLIHSHLHASMEAARREFQALKILHPEGVAVPEPIAREKHIVVTKIFRGVEISSAQFIKDPSKIFSKILDNIIRMYNSGIVHSDLSIYNILVTQSEEIVIIDWPQWVRIDHPMAHVYLSRDLTNLIKYFRRRWRINIIQREYQDFIDKILGETFNTAKDKNLLKGVSG